jgi:Holliday junction resolvasome RuvABC endonuclease subunit
MYLGLDQSLRSSGVAVVSGKGEVIYLGLIPTGALRGVQRLAAIRNALRDVLGAEPDIKYAALEGYSIESVNRPFDLGELGGVVRLALHDAGVPFLVVPPKSLKLFVASDGAADKEKMRKAVLKKWGQDIEQDDECDAFGLAQLARSFHLNTGTTRAELEVLKKLRDTSKKITLVAPPATGISI